MKHRFLIILICLFAFAISQANTNEGSWQFGIKTSGSYDKVSIRNGGKSKLGYKLGFLAEKHLLYMLYFQPSVQYSQKSYEYEIRNGFHEITTYNAIEIDAGLLLKFGDDRLKRGMFFSITPYISKGFAVKSIRTNINPNSTEYNQTITSKEFDYINKNDAGFKLGIGYDFNKHFEIAANYTFGFNKINNTTNYKWRGFALHLVFFI